eukprot:comp23332_c0_seq1/m.38446 comp23332_c0_seq1/g.38446  ORF comp23332_c0_seq1/g.38446 comp23332_c0_seq1/m.38446 type:complete len:437 (-) comp23332_c0_seq1:202-1512(-)
MAGLATSLLGLLERADSPLEALGPALQSAFPQSALRFDAGCALAVLLDDQTLLTSPWQRILALYMLYDMYKGEPIGANPFLPIFVKVAESGTLLEQHFISNIIGVPAKDVFKSTARQLADTYSSLTSPPPMPNLPKLVTLCTRRKGWKPSISALIPDPGPPRGEGPGGGHEDSWAEAVTGLLKDADATPPALSWTPTPMRPIPPFLEATDDELLWLNPHEVDDVLQWDTTVCVDTSQGAEIRALMARAFREALEIPLRDKVIGALEADPKLVYHIGLMPSRLPDLVENNPILAIEVLLRLMQSSQISEYLSVLVNMDMSLHSMEVVNRLTTAVDLPTEFIHLYISNCIHTCDTIKDKYMQNRLVRLVCVFLQSLIRNRIINVQELFVEVQAFCIEHSRIREAAGLFRLLKTLDHGENGGDGDGDGENEAHGEDRGP